MSEAVYPGKYRINWSITERPQLCTVCEKYTTRDSTQGSTPCNHIFHRTCLLNVLARGPFCPKCLAHIPLETDPITKVEKGMAIVDELSLSEYDRHMYVAEVHKIYACRSRADQFHDTLQLHNMAIRNHEQWAKTAKQDCAEGIRRGLYKEAMKYRKKAVEAEKRAMEAENNGDNQGAWNERQEAAVAGYKAAKAEDERH